MKEFISKEGYIEMADNDFRAIDMYIFEITNTLSNFLGSIRWKEKRFFLKKKLKKAEVFEIAGLVAKRLRKFVFQSCKTCRGRCIFEKEKDAEKMFEYNVFRKGIKKENIPERLIKMRRIDFFLYEFTDAAAVCIYSYLKAKYSEKLSNAVFNSVVDHIISFTKDNCLDNCHIACLEKPFDKNFHCFHCKDMGNDDLCPYNGSRREYLSRSS
jgi:hypothetical protein